MWQWEEFEELIATGKVQTFATHQSDFGVDYPKPTRFIWKGTTELPSCCKRGASCFRHGRHVPEPLIESPRQDQDLSLRQAQSSGLQHCAQATHLIDALETLPATTASGEIGASPSSPSRRPCPVNPPEGPAVLGGWGEPRSCPTVSGTKGFHDGGGLCSPGRWPPERRWHASDHHWGQLRRNVWEIVMNFVGGESRLEKECSRVATKGEKGCRLVTDMELRQETAGRPSSPKEAWQWKAFATARQDSR